MAVQSQCAPSERRQVSTRLSATCLRQWGFRCFVAAQHIQGNFFEYEMRHLKMSQNKIQYLCEDEVINAVPSYHRLS